MSISVNNIISPNITQLENIVGSQSSQIQQLIDLYSDTNKRSYDQTTKQNVTISFNELNQKYRFEINKDQENDVFMYQIWKKNSELNSDRIYKYKKLREWIYIFKNQLNFTPTTLIEINEIFYPAVMVDATIENDSCIFYFQTTSITPTVEKSLPKTGSYNNVRFDIDSSPPSYLIGTWYGYSTTSYYGNSVTINSDGTLIKTQGSYPGTYNLSYNLGYDFNYYIYINNTEIICLGLYSNNNLTLTYSVAPGQPTIPNEIYNLLT